MNLPFLRAKYLNKEGVAWFRAGRYDEAQTALSAALFLREKALDPSDSWVATSLNNLAEVRFVDQKPNLNQAWGIGPELKKGDVLELENLILVPV